MLPILRNLPKILICVLLFLFGIAIIYDYLKKDILEGLENPNSDEEDNSSSCQATPSKNSGQIEFIRNSLEQLKAKVENNTKNLAKLNEEKEEVKKNRNMINHNSKAILKATTASKLSKKQDSILHNNEKKNQ